jgi:hypothetical protein
MTRLALIALAALIIFGVVVSILPAPKSEAKAEVLLEGVSLELYPAADPDAKWFFSAKDVRYNPETRESTVRLEGIGQRVLKGKVDLELRSDVLTIDSQDNLRLIKADVFVPEGCYALRLQNKNDQGEGSGFVTIDQNSGYSAPFIHMRYQGSKSQLYGFTSGFALDNTKFAEDPRNKFLSDIDSKESCESVRADMGWNKG